MLEQIGERSLLLPELINRGLAANDRLQYDLTLLQTARVYAQAPGQQIPNLRHEREDSGITDSAFDDVIAASRMVTDSTVYIPGVASIVEHVLDDVRHMVDPIAAASSWRGDLAERAALYARRLDEQAARAPSCTDDEIPSGTIDAFTRLPSNGHDSLHQLVMDLHWELNRLQASVSVEVIDGAHAYGLGDSDRRLVRAFMRGVNQTAPLKLDHPGLDTTATHDGDHLSIQSDLGVADTHVVVVHVAGLVATLIYTDVHRARAQFVRDLLEPHHLTWSTDGHGSHADGYDMSVGSFTAADEDALDQFLTYLGSRLVFLIGWNRARKRLSRVVRKSDAAELLKWAADNNIGHEAFLKAGDVRLIHNALDRAAPTQIYYGARLDEILGRDAAKRFLMSVLRIASTGAARRSSPRLIDDEIEAELMMYLQRSDRSFLGAVADHAMVIAEMVDWIRRAIAQLKNHQQPDGAGSAALLKSWKTDAGTIIRLYEALDCHRRTRRAAAPPAVGGRQGRQGSRGGRVRAHAAARRHRRRRRGPARSARGPREPRRPRIRPVSRGCARPVARRRSPGPRAVPRDRRSARDARRQLRRGGARDQGACASRSLVRFPRGVRPVRAGPAARPRDRLRRAVRPARPRLRAQHRARRVRRQALSTRAHVPGAGDWSIRRSV